MGTAYVDPDIRMLDQSQIGRVLTGDPVALRHRGPVTALLIQNTNPMNIAPEAVLCGRVSCAMTCLSRSMSIS